jgi:23S rRNA (uridine2552-2'-O)-methyltransferase
MKKKGRWADHYAHRAKMEKWPARSIYKLEEIDNKFRLIKKGHKLLDLGCYPGSWSQYCLQKTGSSGEVIGIDFKKPEHLTTPNFHFIEGDIFYLKFDMNGPLKIADRNLVLSDMAPKTTGMRTTDASRSMELAEKALEISCLVLREKGHFLCKLFENEDINHFKKEILNHFERVFLIRPKAVRKGSREIYILGMDFKSNAGGNNPLFS